MKAVQPRIHVPEKHIAAPTEVENKIETSRLFFPTNSNSCSEEVRQFHD